MSGRGGKFAELYGASGKTKAEPAALPDDDDEVIDPAIYSGCRYNRSGKPVMGFFIELKNGDMDGFLYQHVNFPKYRMREGKEMISFTYSGSAIDMVGKGLQPYLERLLMHTVKGFVEYDGRKEIKAGSPVIQSVNIRRVVNPKADMQAEVLNLVKSN